MIMDVLTGQMTLRVIQRFNESNTYVFVPRKTINYYQPFELTVNGDPKRFLKNNFNEWHSFHFNEWHSFQVLKQ